MTNPKPIKTASRICFGIAYFSTEAEAVQQSEINVANNVRINGGMMHGGYCLRDPGSDHVDPELGQLYACLTR